MKKLAGGAVVLIAFALVAIVPPVDLRAAAMLCLCGILLAGFTLITMWRRAREAALPTGLFIMSFSTAWFIAPLWLLLLAPDSVYVNYSGIFPITELLGTFELVGLLFLAVFATVTLTFLPRVREMQISFEALHASMWLALLANVLGWLGQLREVSEAVTLFSNACRNYLTGLTFVVGKYWMLVKPRYRILTVIGILSAFGFHTIANSRGMALFPVLLFGAGFMLRGKLTKATLIAFGVSAALLPVYAVVANQTRAALGTIGLANVDERVSALRRALESGLILETSGYSIDFAKRMFPIGGHRLIVAAVKAPAGFDFGRLLDEAWSNLLPAFIGERPPEGDYVGSAVLRPLGFEITEKTSVDVSLAGSLFSWAGYWAVAIGALFTAGAFALYTAVSVAALRKRYLGPSLLAAGCLVGITAPPLDVVLLTKNLLWTVVYVVAAQLLVATAVSFFRRAAAVPSSRNVLVPYPGLAVPRAPRHPWRTKEQSVG
jgi:hypothetical protein